MKDLISKIILLAIILLALVDIKIAKGEEIGTASYYTIQSSGNITANGEQFNEDALTCASNDYPFNTMLKVTNIENGKFIFCRVNDRGGFKKYGRIIDLSKGAFKTIGDLKVGLLTVKIEEQPSSKVLVSKQKIYPSYIKTPQDIEDWLIKEGFKYIPDKTREDSWKTPEHTIKDKGGDCEDYGILTDYILEDLGYKNVMLIALYGKDLAHGICWFQELDGTWSFFSTGIDGKGNSKFYFNCKVSNPFNILYLYFSEWTHIKVCTKQGYPVKIFYRKDLEKGVKK
jgi:rare lipoprotein A